MLGLASLHCGWSWHSAGRQWPASPCKHACRSVAESIVHGQHMVWGKKVVNSPFGWKMVQKFNSSFGPGSPVTVLGRVARANSAHSS